MSIDDATAATKVFSVWGCSFYEVYSVSLHKPNPISTLSNAWSGLLVDSFDPSCPSAGKKPSNIPGLFREWHGNLDSQGKHILNDTR